MEISELLKKNHVKEKKKRRIFIFPAFHWQKKSDYSSLIYSSVLKNFANGVLKNFEVSQEKTYIGISF